MAFFGAAVSGAAGEINRGISFFIFSEWGVTRQFFGILSAKR
jgi:hypothetical protein